MTTNELDEVELIFQWIRRRVEGVASLAPITAVLNRVVNAVAHTYVEMCRITKNAALTVERLKQEFSAERSPAVVQYREKLHEIMLLLKECNAIIKEAESHFERDLLDIAKELAWLCLTEALQEYYGVSLESIRAKSVE